MWLLSTELRDKSGTTVHEIAAFAISVHCYCNTLTENIGFG